MDAYYDVDVDVDVEIDVDINIDVDDDDVDTAVVPAHHRGGKPFPVGRSSPCRVLWWKVEVSLTVAYDSFIFYYSLLECQFM